MPSVAICGRYVRTFHLLGLYWVWKARKPGFGIKDSAGHYHLYLRFLLQLWFDLDQALSDPVLRKSVSCSEMVPNRSLGHGLSRHRLGYSYYCPGDF